MKKSKRKEMQKDFEYILDNIRWLDADTVRNMTDIRKALSNLNDSNKKDVEEIIHRQLLDTFGIAELIKLTCYKNLELD